MTEMGHALPTGETAIVIVPPRDICGFADHYRSLYMPDMVRLIEPHVTVTYPFAPYAQLPTVEWRLREALVRCEPVWLSLRGFEVFLETGILYLRLARPERVASIYRSVLAEFPEYPAYGGQHGDNFVPHLTVGRFDDPNKLSRAYNELGHIRLYIGWTAESVVVKYRVEDGKWLTWKELPLLGEE